MPFARIASSISRAAAAVLFGMLTIACWAQEPPAAPTPQNTPEARPLPVLNYSQLLRHVANEFRGRVFATMESMVWFTMMVSMTLAGLASQYYDARAIGAVAGVLSSTTAIFWGWAHWTGRLPEPAREGVDPEDVEVHGEPTV